ncbi:MAG: hypothetical protein IT546_02365 [Caulobacteraceae bacterium]|nr:hypothetical protein [Caulobacteraceae bacterium]
MTRMIVSLPGLPLSAARRDDEDDSPAPTPPRIFCSDPAAPRRWSAGFAKVRFEAGGDIHRVASVARDLDSNKCLKRRCGCGHRGRYFCDLPIRFSMKHRF